MYACVPCVCLSSFLNWYFSFCNNNFACVIEDIHQYSENITNIGGGGLSYSLSNSWIWPCVDHTISGFSLKRRRAALPCYALLSAALCFASNTKIVIRLCIVNKYYSMFYILLTTEIVKLFDGPESSSSGHFFLLFFSDILILLSFFPLFFFSFNITNSFSRPFLVPFLFFQHLFSFHFPLLFFIHFLPKSYATMGMAKNSPLYSFFRLEH